MRRFVATIALAAALAGCQTAEDVRSAPPLLARDVAVGWQEMFACLTERHQQDGVGHSPVMRPREETAALLAYLQGRNDVVLWEMRIRGTGDRRSRVEHRTTLSAGGNWYGAREFNLWVPACEAAERGAARRPG